MIQFKKNIKKRYMLQDTEKMWGTLAVPCGIKDNNQYWFATQVIEELFNIANDSLRCVIKSKRFKKYCEFFNYKIVKIQESSYINNRSQQMWYDLDSFLVIAGWSYIINNNANARKVLPPATRDILNDYIGKKFPHKKPEDVVRNKYVKILKGKPEEKTDVGIVDILTKDHTYEVKKISLWKHALGQALAYSVALNKKPGVILYGKESYNGNIHFIRDIFDKYQVTLILD